ncbi:polysaccharide pyruvyl transferase family protein [Parabacteroides chongii]|uniref:polysaccharide pyruvyl transferase family protein n=1 Tax=Parabacteroides chongii TaxID=2685834 RepID=UPI00240D661A|nr:polysaccharide pyruvyl transferase family protein [Parabacteroides chongii]WFE83575.1 polysaccharide pyruvyl transferase family protein [Parabacteroides chongii]
MKKNRQQRIFELRTLIDEKILPLITSDYVLWGLPYYINPGDTLIWNGALSLLKGCPHKCIGTCGWDEYRYQPLNKDTVILIIGGGFFGDLWRKAWSGVMDIITRYPDNPIMILPQSIFYQNPIVAKEDAERLAKCKNLTICTRDKQSFDYATTFFSFAKTLFVPDLAFHMDVNLLYRCAVKQTDKVLYLKRNDKELVQDKADIIGENVERKDWPAMSGNYSFSMRVVCALYLRLSKRKNKFYRCLITLLMKYGHRCVVTRDAVRFISSYKTIYTTRLHVMILSFLLDKEIYILDNSYGKISGCYDAWLKGCDNIYIYSKND